MYKVFVYGSLKNDYWNNYLLQKPTTSFLGEAITEEKFLMGTSGFPYLFTEKCVKEYTSKPFLPVFGEVYEIGAEVLKDLDWLEGVDGGHYDRIKTSVRIAGDLVVDNVFVYVAASKDYLSHLTWPNPEDKLGVSCYVWSTNK